MTDTLNANTLLTTLWQAFEQEASTVAKGLSEESLAMVKTGLTHIAERLVAIQALYAAGELTQADAQSLLQLQREAMEEQLLTIEGFTKILAQASINAALKAIRTSVNDVLGWALL